MKRRNKNKRQKRRNRNGQAFVAKSNKMRVTGGPLKNLRVKHREYIRDIIGDSNIVQKLFIPVNPGLSATFPWLSGIASRFESYKLMNFRVKYVPQVSTITNGGIAISPDYDSSDDNSSTSKARILTYEDTVRGNVWSSLVMRCGNSNLSKRKQYFVREDVLKANNDIKLYDALQLIVLVTGPITDGLVLGELWLEYDVQFYTPQLEPDELDDKVGHARDNLMSAGPLTGLKDELEGELDAKIESTFEQNDTVVIDKPGKYEVSLLGLIDVLAGSATTQSWEGIQGIKELITYFTEGGIPPGGGVGTYNATAVFETESEVDPSNPAKIKWPGVVRTEPTPGDMFQSMIMTINPISSELFEGIADFFRLEQEEKNRQKLKREKERNESGGSRRLVKVVEV